MKNFKRIIAFTITAFIVLSSCSAAGWGDLFAPTEPSAQQKQTTAQKENLNSAVTAYPTPQVRNFVERKTITEWTKRWDKTSVVTYCYVFIGSTPIGYFVTNGKPASTQSYLIPETRVEGGHDLGESYGDMIVESPDLDGCYGANNPGYRFFLANGTAVECSGAMVSMIYSDAPLSLKCPIIESIK